MFDAATEPTPDDHATVLSTLARADRRLLTETAELVLPDLGAVEVLKSRTGLVMLPLRDTVKGTDFHLGEVLVAEAHIRCGGFDGYGMVLGRDLERAMAMAVLDAAWQRGIRRETVASLASAERARLEAEDNERLRRIEATRVEMETF